MADHAASLLVEIVGTTATRLANSRIEPDRPVRTCREVRRMQRLRLKERKHSRSAFGPLGVHHVGHEGWRTTLLVK